MSISGELPGLELAVASSWASVWSPLWGEQSRAFAAPELTAVAGWCTTEFRPGTRVPHHHEYFGESKFPITFIGLSSPSKNLASRISKQTPPNSHQLHDR